MRIFDPEEVDRLSSKHVVSVRVPVKEGKVELGALSPEFTRR